LFSRNRYHRARIDYDLGMLHKISKRLDEARADLARVIAGSPKKAEALLAKIEAGLAGPWSRLTDQSAHIDPFEGSRLGSSQREPTAKWT
jgi:hypothetical protein